MTEREVWEACEVDVVHGGGPESVLCDTPPAGMPTTGRVGFTLPPRHG